MDDMNEQELLALKKQKAKLLKKACDLRDKLREKETSQSTRSGISSLILPYSEKSRTSPDNKPFEKHIKKLCDVSRKVTGITFDSVDKNWLHDNVYHYVSSVITRTLSFRLDLTVDLQSDDNFEVLDITCLFINIEPCYSQEITPWVQRLTRLRNFSLFITAMANYNEYSILRAKILHKLESANYVSVQQCTKKEGGILFHVHPPKTKNRVLLEFHWTLQFLDQTWQIEHSFVINSTEIGSEFAQQYKSLFEKFCKITLSKEELEQLWLELCTAIDKYENNT